MPEEAKEPPVERADAAEALKELLRDKCNKIDEVIKQKKVPATELSEVKLLDEFVRIRESLDKPDDHKKPGSPYVYAIVILLILLCVLAFVRMPVTEVDLSLVLSGVSFETAEARLRGTEDADGDNARSGAQQLTETQALDRIEVEGIDRIKIPPAHNGGAVVKEAEDMELYVDDRPPEDPVGDDTVSDGSQDADGGAAETSSSAGAGLSLWNLGLPTGTHVEVRPEGEFRIGGGKDGVVIGAYVRDDVEVNIYGAEDVFEKTLKFFDIGKIECEAEGPNHVAVRLMPNGSQPIAFNPAIEISGLRVTALTDDADGGADQFAPSTVISGEVVFNDLEGKRLPLESGVMLQLEELTGTLYDLTISEGRIELRFRGDVGDLRVGRRERSRMPSMLAWIYSATGIKLILTVVGSVLGTVLAFQRVLAK